MASHAHTSSVGGNSGGGNFGDVAGKAIAGRLYETGTPEPGIHFEGTEYLFLVEGEGGSQPHNHGLHMNSQNNEPQHVCCVPLIYLPGA